MPYLIASCGWAYIAVSNVIRTCCGRPSTAPWPCPSSYSATHCRGSTRTYERHSESRSPETAAEMYKGGVVRDGVVVGVTGGGGAEMGGGVERCAGKWAR